MNGKGDTYRQVSREAYDRGWEQIDWADPTRSCRTCARLMQDDRCGECRGYDQWIPREQYDG